MASGMPIAGPIECLPTSLDKRSLIVHSKLIDPGSPTLCFHERNSTVNILSCNVRLRLETERRQTPPALRIVTISASQSLHMLHVGCLGN